MKVTIQGRERDGKVRVSRMEISQSDDFIGGTYEGSVTLSGKEAHALKLFLQTIPFDKEAQE